METLLQSLRSELEALIQLVPRAALALGFLVLSIVLGRLLGSGVGKVLARGSLSPTHRTFFRRLTTWAVSLLGLAVALDVVGLTGVASGLLAGGGITAVILGFAFRQIGENFLAGFLLAFNRPFKIDDVIQSGEFKGTVREVELRHTHIRTADGRDIYIPNSEIINRPLVNFTRDGLLRPSFTVGIDYADDAGRACALLTEVVDADPAVAREPPVSVVVSGLDASWVLLEVAFWLDTLQPGIALAEVKSRVMDGSRQALLEAGFTVSASVTTRVVLAPEPGSPDPPASSQTD